MQKEDEVVQRSRDADALRSAFAREGCPVCTVIQEYMQHLMDSWQYEGFTDFEQRHELIRSRGFCPLHTWQLAQLAPFQLAVVYREVLTDMLADMERDQRLLARRNSLEAGPAWLRWWRRWHRRPATISVKLTYEQCPFCQSRVRIEQRVVSTLLEQLRSEEMRALLCESTGLCQVHFTQACTWAEGHDPRELASLFTCQHTCVRRVLDEVQELLRKHDYRFSEEPRGNEMTSWRRAADLCAGNPGVL